MIKTLNSKSEILNKSQCLKSQIPNQINPAPSNGVLNPAGRIHLIPIHPRSKLRGILGRCGINCRKNQNEVWNIGIYDLEFV